MSWLFHPIPLSSPLLAQRAPLRQPRGFAESPPPPPPPVAGSCSVWAPFRCWSGRGAAGMGGCARRGVVVSEGPADPPRFGDTLNIGSSTGWTDEKHMHYISSLELSFVTQLYDGEANSKGTFCWSPSVWRHKTSYIGNNRNTEVDQQGHWCMVGADGAESTGSQTGHTGSPLFYEDLKDKAYSLNDDASTSESRKERIIHHVRQDRSGGSSASHFHWHGHSLSRTELSGQNFVDDDNTGVRGEQSREYSKKRLKHAADTTSSPAAPSSDANLQQEVFHHLEVEYSGSSSDFGIGSLDTELASCESQGGPRR